MKKYVKFINCVILLLAVLSTLGSCAGPSLKKKQNIRYRNGRHG